MLPSHHRRAGSPARAGIDLSRRASSRTARRLPRTRGDRPWDACGDERLTPAPPHARGSTAHHVAEAAPCSGSPARAGIDPRQHREGVAPLRLPRTRGDRPQKIALIKHVYSAPPHARGSTLPPRRRVREVQGSPARAGIDRFLRRSFHASWWLPRTRGDRPEEFSPETVDAEAPPHARGSTRGQEQEPLLRGGSPARAGIDRARARSHGVVRGLPRTRGDRPCTRTQSRCRQRAPPHARGSTRPFRLRGRNERGSPARAGIDRILDDEPSTSGGLPRTRGDRPRPDLTDAEIASAPPHARGSTRFLPRLRPRGRGSPARAGIDPTDSTRRSAASRLPRTRGDRPAFGLDISYAARAPPHARGSTLIETPPSEGSSGSPARAGIDPRDRRNPARRARLPRTRGDRPIRFKSWTKQGAAPPHARGSTLGRVQRGDRRHGSPARAGIDPCRSMFSTSIARLPRTRGDRPQSAAGSIARAMAPPHARGSTLHLAGVDLGGVGSPARAGIAPAAPRTTQVLGGSPAYAGIDPCSRSRSFSSM